MIAKMPDIEKPFTHILHTYMRSEVSKEVYRCIHPDCKHYHRRAFLIGKRAECHKCHESFILTKSKLRCKYPVCDTCSKSPKAKELILAQELVAKGLFESITQEVIDKTLE